MSEAPVILGGILSVPAGTHAVIFDVDGVVLDSLAGDLSICIAAADEVLGDSSWLTREAVEAHFALDPPHFWKVMAGEKNVALSPAQLDAVVARYNELRASWTFEPLAGIAEIVADIQAKGIACAVASSNDLDVVKAMLGGLPFYDAFSVISGLGADGIAPKPAADLYSEAVRQLGVDAADCVFIEDSLTGLTAGKAAGIGYAVAVATGSTSFAALEQSGLADAVYDRFAAPHVVLIDDTPTNKTLDTANDFVSHMVEHIAWRLGVGIDLGWRSNDWRALGVALGHEVGKLGLTLPSAATLGMIDDGAAEVLIDREAQHGLDFDTHVSLPRQAVIDMRVEQLSRGSDLLLLLEGLAEGLQAFVAVRLCTFEDPHHSWEGVFRATGICLARLREAA